MQKGTKSLNIPIPQRILITGHCGLIGTALSHALIAQGHHVRGLDVRATGADRGDLCDRPALKEAMEDCDGVIHLGAVSRVIDGELDPQACWAVNAEGTQQLVDVARKQFRNPWLIYASSREVYGEVEALPANEDTPRRPINIYGRSKVAGEDAVLASGLRSSIVRFSNVYGSAADYVDRVVPAFCRQACTNQPLRVDGSGHTFDFTHVSDTVRGLLLLIGKLQAGHESVTLHFLTGQPTRLDQLAKLAVELANSSSQIYEASPRNFDVGLFYGDGSRAKSVLGWRPEVSLREGLRQLIQDFRTDFGAVHRLTEGLPAEAGRFGT